MFTLISLFLRLRAMNSQPVLATAPIVAANDTRAVEQMARAA
jgi:hypothetical protein